MDFELVNDGLDNLVNFLNRLTKKIEITIQDIKIENLDDSLSGITIAQISDLHIYKWNVELIEQTITILNSLKPDIVTMTGDAICNGKKFIPDLTRIFKEINANYGKFACLGNHDHSDGDDSLLVQKFYRKVDFQVLVNDSDRINVKGEPLYIAGADDIEMGIQNLNKMVKKIPKDATSIFLAHNPVNFAELARLNPDLVLSGHTHGGQLYVSILKFIYKLRLQSNYLAGLYALKKSSLYVNRGIGTALFSPELFNKKFILNTPRINSKPEITLFRLVRG